MKMFLVGGAVRDELMGIPLHRIKDLDFAVEAESFETMRAELVAQGFDIFLETPEYLTIRARFPRGHEHAASGLTADFVLCRIDGPTLDHRRPAFVEPGTIFDDLARRDFTMNAIARDIETGELIDPHGGAKDITDRVIRFVGDPMVRIREDALRAIRALRFRITKDFRLSPSTEYHILINNAETIRLLEHISIERIEAELRKMFNHDTLTTLFMLRGMDQRLIDVMFRDNKLKLNPTLAERLPGS